MNILKVKRNGQWVPIAAIKGDKGDAGQGIPTGGTAGQVLKKRSASNYDTEWVDDSSLPDVIELNNAAPQGGLLPDKVYLINTSGYETHTISLASAIPGKQSQYQLYIRATSAIPPFITFSLPTGTIWDGGSAPMFTGRSISEINIIRVGDITIANFKSYSL